MKTKTPNKAEAEFFVTLGAVLRQHRLAAGFSQEDLAEQIGVTFQQVQKFESGKNRISLYKLMKAAEALNVPMSAFMNGRQSPPVKTRFEGELLKHYRTMTPPLQKALLMIVRGGS